MRSLSKILIQKVAVYILLSIMLASSCGQKAVKPAPDFSVSQNRLSAFNARLKSISNTLTEELIGLNNAMNDVSLLNTIEYSDSFPKNIFKHALMACLNDNAHNVEESEELGKEAVAFGITCNVLPLKSLLKALDEPENLLLAQKGMQALEKVRRHRSQIQKIIREIPDDVFEIRKEINIQNGELRRKKAYLQTKRNDYSSNEWDNANNAIKEFQSQLNELKREVKTVLLNKNIWFQKLGSEIDVLYKDIAKLGEQ